MDCERVCDWGSGRSEDEALAFCGEGDENEDVKEDEEGRVVGSEVADVDGILKDAEDAARERAPN